MKKQGKPPPGYVAGAGRGAIGFTTRSDIGPARAAVDSRAPPGFQHALPPKEPLSESGDYSDSRFDTFTGFAETLFAKVVYDKDDIEADAIYAAIDRRMDSKRKKRREQLAEESKRQIYQKQRELIEEFAEDKKKLASLTELQWESIPEAGIQTKKRYKVNTSSRAEKFSPVPDSVIQNARRVGATSTNVVDGGIETPMMSPAVVGTATPSSLTSLGSAQQKVLGMTLNRLADSVDGQTVVDPKGYLTDLKTLAINSETDISDIQKARLLLKSVTQSNPNSAPGQLASARLEEHAGRLSAARRKILKATEMCPDNEDVWLEAARLHPPESARSILANSVRRIPKSVKIWIQASKLERDKSLKKAVLRRALEIIPRSVELQKTAIELENENDARIMLTRAVECVPNSVDMQLALASLETYDNARKVLNQARQNIPTSIQIWIAASKLEEAHGSGKLIDKIIIKAIKSLKQNGVVIDRDTQLQEAASCEESASNLTCQAIVRATIGTGIEEQDRRATWTHDAESFLAKGRIVTARAIYSHILSNFPTKHFIQWDAAQLEKKHGTYTSLIDILKTATTYCPNTESLQLMLAKEKQLNGDLEGSRQTLSEAFTANPGSEAITLAAVKLECENENYDKARELLKRARNRNDCEPRVQMKSAVLERELNNEEGQVNLLEQALFSEDLKLSARCQKFPKLQMMLAQSHINAGEYGKARQIFQKAISKCSSSIQLRINFARFELESGLKQGLKKQTYSSESIACARTILETARLKFPKSPLLQLESIKLEAINNSKLAQRLLSKALQECPKSGILWAYSIENEIRPKQRARCHDALKALSDDAHVFLAAAKIFWAGRRDKAKNWFERAVGADRDFGDAWAYYYAYLLRHGTVQEQEALLKRCSDAEPRHGEKWINVSKKVGNWRLKTEDILKQVADQVKYEIA